MHAGDGGDAAVGAVEGESAPMSTLAEAVAVGEDEGVGVDVAGARGYARAGAGLEAGLGSVTSQSS